MNLADLYLSMQEADGQIEKTAAETDNTEGEGEGEQELEQVAEAIADAELDKEASIKLAAEYDSAGRIMARGFYDELHKLAAEADTHVVPNNTARPSAAKTPALGERGDPELAVNYAGSRDHMEGIKTTGPGPKQVYKDVLKDGKRTSVGSGVTMSPPVVGGFATIKDITR